MQLAFTMPHIHRIKALVMSWEERVTGADQTRLAKWADKLGFGMLYVPEHHIIPRKHLELSGPHHLSAYSTMAYWAGATENIRVNATIAQLALQHPIVTAKALSSMDWLSSGRVTITFGAGWLEGEFKALGVDFHQRGAMCEEYIQAIIELWTKENPEFEGTYVNFRDMAFEPKCFQTPHVPIWFGGDADAVLHRTARYASGWAPFLTKPEDFPAKIDYIKSQPDYSGQLKDVFYSFITSRVGEGHVAINDPKARAGQHKQAILDRLGWFNELGVTWSALPVPELNHVEEYFDYTQWIAEEIMPAVATTTPHAGPAGGD
jgi:probable F420-dependent oxidoreductase